MEVNIDKFTIFSIIYIISFIFKYSYNDAKAYMIIEKTIIIQHAPIPVKASSDNLN